MKVKVELGKPVTTQCRKIWAWRDMRSTV